MKRPEEVKLSQDEGEALIERVSGNRLTESDQQVLVKLIRLYFWLTFALQETKISLGRLKRALFGKGRNAPTADNDDPDDSGASSERGSSASTPPAADSQQNHKGDEQSEQRRGHGRKAASSYTGAEHVVCDHEQLSVGERCPVCGRGTLYALPPGVEIRVDGNALLSAVHYELEKLRCSSCGEIFTASLPADVEEKKYSDQAQAVVALSRYYLGVPFHRLEGFQALVGVPVADATLWELAERVADSAYPVFERLKYDVAQSELIFQDDTSVRIQSLQAENRQQAATASDPANAARTGMYTTGLVAKNADHTLVLYLSGREHAGENLAQILALREPGLPKPLVMSDALSANELDHESEVIRLHCLAHGVRQFSDIAGVFPSECQRVLTDLSAVYEHDATTEREAMSGQQRLHYHQRHSGPIMAALKTWLEQQFLERQVEPNSSLGKAFTYLLKRWESLTRFLAIPNAPLDNNTVERSLKLVIRQRNTSLFYASTHSAYVASALSSLLATCVENGINALNYLIALQQNRSAVFGQPAAWLPWCYSDQLGLT